MKIRALPFPRFTQSDAAIDLIKIHGSTPELCTCLGGLQWTSKQLQSMLLQEQKTWDPSEGRDDLHNVNSTVPALCPPSASTSAWLICRVDDLENMFKRKVYAKPMLKIGLGKTTQIWIFPALLGLTHALAADRSCKMARTTKDALEVFAKMISCVHEITLFSLVFYVSVYLHFYTISSIVERYCGLYLSPCLKIDAHAWYSSSLPTALV